jgi:Mg2+-importing ATPase
MSRSAGPSPGSVLFALAIAVGLTPQLLPAIVTVSLSTGARRLAERSVIVKRLVAIEDLGNIEILFTDKTGTLTEGRISFVAALDPGGSAAADVLRLGQLCNDAVVDGGAIVGGNPLDQALWHAPAAKDAGLAGYRRLAARPFDYERGLGSALIEGPDGKRAVIVKGAPELVLGRCRGSPQRRGRCSTSSSRRACVSSPSPRGTSAGRRRSRRTTSASWSRPASSVSWTRRRPTRRRRSPGCARSRSR